MTPSRPTLEELAAAEIDADDVDVLRRTAAVYDALDPVPAGLVDRITFGITLDSLADEIAELQRTGDLTGVRSDAAAETQTITFTSSTMTTMVTVSQPFTDRLRIDGWCAPGGGVEVELRVGASCLTTTADADGRFVFEDVTRGLAQFILRPPPGAGPSTIVTPAIEI